MLRKVGVKNYLSMMSIPFRKTQHSFIKQGFTEDLLGVFNFRGKRVRKTLKFPDLIRLIVLY